MAKFRMKLFMMFLGVGLSSISVFAAAPKDVETPDSFRKKYDVYIFYKNAGLKGETQGAAQAALDSFNNLHHPVLRERALHIIAGSKEGSPDESLAELEIDAEPPKIIVPPAAPPRVRPGARPGERLVQGVALGKVAGKKTPAPVQPARGGGTKTNRAAAQVGAKAKVTKAIPKRPETAQAPARPGKQPTGVGGKATGRAAAKVGANAKVTKAIPKRPGTAKAPARPVQRTAQQGKAAPKKAEQQERHGQILAEQEAEENLLCAQMYDEFETIKDGLNKLIVMYERMDPHFGALYDNFVRNKEYRDADPESFDGYVKELITLGQQLDDRLKTRAEQTTIARAADRLINTINTYKYKAEDPSTNQDLMAHVTDFRNTQHFKRYPDVHRNWSDNITRALREAIQHYEKEQSGRGKHEIPATHEQRKTKKETISGEPYTLLNARQSGVGTGHLWDCSYEMVNNALFIVQRLKDADRHRTAPNFTGLAVAPYGKWCPTAAEFEKLEPDQFEIKRIIQEGNLIPENQYDFIALPYIYKDFKENPRQTLPALKRVFHNLLTQIQENNTVIHLFFVNEGAHWIVVVLHKVGPDIIYYIADDTSSMRKDKSAYEKAIELFNGIIR